VDWSSWYLTDEEDMGESTEHGLIIRVLLSVLLEWVRERGWSRVFVAQDQFFAWVPSQPLVRVSPDVYLMDIDESLPSPLPDSWQTWLPGHRPPRFAVEVVSQDRKKDYEDAPLKYALLGARELVIFDPGAVSGRDPSQRMPLQLYRRNAVGAFLRVYAGAGPVHSVELDAYLIMRREGSSMRLRLARDAAGQDLVPTTEEARHQAEQRVAREAEARHQAEQRATTSEQRAAREAEARHQAEQRTAREAEARHQAEERTAREAEARHQAEVRIRELEEMIKKLRG
ncbi:MAG TPA: Uma2 family endonuclease, partial [Polyangia bacterium]|nr:Uma2 family endonuclease [Polyangia bacterium]